MSPRAVKAVVEMIDFEGYTGIERARLICRAGVTVEEYRRYERTRTIRCAAIGAACVFVAWVIMSLIVGDWTP